ncbi:hypothetical protein GCM10023187_26610 [Nibrella viscosa]|uniref:Protein argonaute n=2 Tax=Nibrella viscosa TaxID=1084524 RepID=A0ABP8KHG4_9BACT
MSSNKSKSNLILEFDEFLRAIKVGNNDTYTTLLGAGASISSGVQSATDCIWEWKKEIYVTKSNDTRDWVENFKIDAVKNLIQGWLDNQGTFLPLGDNREYSYYAEKCYPLEKNRKDYFAKICKNKEPSVGYKLLCLLNKKGIISSVWTTNFDALVSKAAHQTNVTPIEISLDSVKRIFTPQNRSELPIIELHGDYRYTPLKNTDSELQEQDTTFRENLTSYLLDKHLIVSGYSGRDKSLMDTLFESYSKRGGGILFWCGYGRDISPEVEELITHARKNGRTAYYVPTDGFDKLMINLSKNIFRNDPEVSSLLTSDKEDLLTDFELDINHYNTVIKSNLYLLELPYGVYQFQINYQRGEKAFKTVKELTKNYKVVAVPFKEFVWAYGSINDIQMCFKGRLKSKITINPNSDLDIWRDSSMYYLMLSTLTRSIAEKIKGKSNGKNIVWLEGQSIILFNRKVYKAVELSIRTDGKRYFLTILPYAYLDENVEKEVRQAIGKAIFEKMRNKEFNEYISAWSNIIFSRNDIEVDYPLGVGSGFNFKVSKIPSYAAIMKAGTRAGLDLIDENFISYKGIQYDEPKLIFSHKNASMQSIPSHFHPMKGLVDNRPYDYDPLNRVHKNAIDLAVVCPSQHSEKLFRFLSRQNTEVKVIGSTSYVIDYPGFYNAFGVSLNVPHPKSDRWIAPYEPFTGSNEIEMATTLAKTLSVCIDNVTRDSTNKIVIIYIPSSWNALLKYNNNIREFDLHDYIKAYCAERGIATQFIREETIGYGLDCQKNWWLALSYYVKSLRTPWIIQGIDKTTAFAGIGYSLRQNTPGNHIILGCSHIYNWQGQGLKYKLSKVEDDIFWDKQENPHLSYNDAFRFGITIRDLFYNAMTELPNRVVVHKRTYFTKDEIRGIKDSLYNSGIEQIDLIEINFEEDIRFIASKLSSIKKLEPDGYAVSRGTCLLFNPKTLLLWTHGIVPAIDNPNYRFYLGGRYIPTPLKVIKHFGEASMGQIATEILGLTKMNWNSFDLYTQLPATVHSSNEIARIGKLLRKKEGKYYDYRYFI